MNSTTNIVSCLEKNIILPCNTRISKLFKVFGTLILLCAFLFQWKVVEPIKEKDTALTNLGQSRLMYEQNSDMQSSFYKQKSITPERVWIIANNWHLAYVDLLRGLKIGDKITDDELKSRWNESANKVNSLEMTLDQYDKYYQEKVSEYARIYPKMVVEIHNKLTRRNQIQLTLYGVGSFLLLLGLLYESEK